MTPQLLASMPSAIARVRTFVRSFFRPVERLSPSRWVEKYIRLPAGHSETQSGAIDFANAPELREPLDSPRSPASPISCSRPDTYREDPAPALRSRFRREALRLHALD